MKKLFGGVLVTLFLALGAGAQNQQGGFVDVPFKFVAAGKTLPAGTYRIARLSEDGLHGLVLSNYESRSGVYVLPNQFEANPSTTMKISFKDIGDTHVLSSIETPDGVYFIPATSSATSMAKAKQRKALAASAAQ